MSKHALKKGSVQTPRTYGDLRRRVKETLFLGLQRVEREKARTYWEVGRSINSHIQSHKALGDHYGARLTVKLSKDLNTSKTALYDAWQFARQYPIFPAQGKLTWTHYRALLSLPDTTVRQRLAILSERENWNSRQLQSRIKAESSARIDPSKSKKSLIQPKLGPLNTYRVIRPKEEADLDLGLQIDLGFAVYIGADQFGQTDLAEGDVIRLAEDKRGHRTIERRSDLGKEDLFTYEALVESVVDGDSVPRKTAQEMRVGPSEPTCGSRFQSALSGVG